VYTYSCLCLFCHTHTLSPGSNMRGSVMSAESLSDHARLVIFPFFTRAMCILFPWVVTTRVENKYNPLIVAVNFPDWPSIRSDIFLYMVKYNDSMVSKVTRWASFRIKHDIQTWIPWGEKKDTSTDTISSGFQIFLSLSSINIRFCMTWEIININNKM
jgi:hypothetical protein